MQTEGIRIDLVRKEVKTHLLHLVNGLTIIEANPELNANENLLTVMQIKLVLLQAVAKIEGVI